jgi:hypothetical protein
MLQMKVYRQGFLVKFCFPARPKCYRLQVETHGYSCPGAGLRKYKKDIIVPVVSITRARLRSIRFLLPFARCTLRCWWQARNKAGNLGVRLRKTRGLRFWTLTIWKDEDALKAYRDVLLRGKVVPRARHWFDENSAARWEQENMEMPRWEDAASRLKEHGHLYEVDHPSHTQKSGRIDIS